MTHNRVGRTRDRDTDSIFPPPFGGGVSSDRRSPAPSGGPGDRRHDVCTVVIGSMTQAMQAEDVLIRATIRAHTVKVSSASTHTGCAYGVEVPCRQMGNVKEVLRGAGIRIRQVLG